MTIYVIKRVSTYPRSSVPIHPSPLTHPHSPVPIHPSPFTRSHWPVPIHPSLYNDAIQQRIVYINAPTCILSCEMNACSHVVSLSDNHHPMRRRVSCGASHAAECAYRSAHQHNTVHAERMNVLQPASDATDLIFLKLTSNPFSSRHTTIFLSVVEVSRDIPL